MDDPRERMVLLEARVVFGSIWAEEEDGAERLRKKRRGGRTRVSMIGEALARLLPQSTPGDKSKT